MKFILLSFVTLFGAHAFSETFCSEQIGGMSTKKVSWIIQRVCEVDGERIVVDLKDRSQCPGTIIGDDPCLADMPSAIYMIITRTALPPYVFTNGQTVERDELLVHDITNNRILKWVESKDSAGKPYNLTGEIADYSVTVYYLH